MDIASGVARPLDDDLRGRLERALAAEAPRRVDISERRKAAVLIPLFERGDEPWIVLTKRTEHVATHKGQISFPGGAHDDTDPDLWTTAVREAEEEIGLPPANARMIGTLDDLPTFSSGFIVSPFVASIEPPGAWTPHDAEVDTVIELPLRRVLEAARTETWEREGIRFPMHIFELEGHYVWGVTAFILHRFLELVGPVLADG